MSDESNGITAGEALKRLAEQEFTREQRIALARYYAKLGDPGAIAALAELESVQATQETEKVDDV